VRVPRGAQRGPRGLRKGPRKEEAGKERCGLSLRKKGKKKKRIKGSLR
jgi:hypothetical protein